MTTTPPEAPPDPTSGAQPHEQPQPYDGPRASRDEMRDLGRLRRTTGPDSKVAGVAGGLARHFDIDPIILRVAFVVLVFFGGAGLIVYGACWLLVPQDDSDSAPLNLDDRSRSVALIVAGVIAGLALLGDSLGQLDFPWPLVFIAAITLVVLAVFDKRGERPRPTAPPVPHQQVPETGEFAPAPGYPAEWAATYSAKYPPTPPAAPTWTPPRHPRKRGPILFWFTLALAALAIGVLGILDVAGLDVADGAYPALVVGICGVMLLIGAFYGRAGGLILVGLLAAVGMAGATASTHWDESDELRPVSASQVEDSYSIGAGELVLDLTDVQDPEALDGRDIRIEAGAGRIEVIVPSDMDVTVEARVGLGDTNLFGTSQDGGGIETSASIDAVDSNGTDTPNLHLDIQVGLGEIDVQTTDRVTGSLR